MVWEHWTLFWRMSAWIGHCYLMCLCLTTHFHWSQGRELTLIFYTTMLHSSSHLDLGCHHPLPSMIWLPSHLTSESEISLLPALYLFLVSQQFFLTQQLLLPPTELSYDASCFYNYNTCTCSYSLSTQPCHPHPQYISCCCSCCTPGTNINPPPS